MSQEQSEQLDKFRRKAVKAMKRGWMKIALREISDNDNHAELDRVYRVPDPWNLDSPTEHVRFESTNRVIERNFGKVGDLLEIGCGEALQSEYLQRLCQRLHGLDVSATAVQRARERIPAATFEVGDLGQQPWVHQGRRFDLAVACEVLYYISDVPATFEHMNRVADACFVTYLSSAGHKLDAVIDAIPGVRKDWSNYGGNCWLMAWWRSPYARGGVSA